MLVKAMSTVRGSAVVNMESQSSKKTWSLPLQSCPQQPVLAQWDTTRILPAGSEADGHQILVNIVWFQQGWMWGKNCIGGSGEEAGLENSLPIHGCVSLKRLPELITLNFR